MFDDSRIRDLLGSLSRTSTIGIIGLGSGGFPLMQHLAMSGWAKFRLVDPDTLDEPNMVKHPGLRVDIGTSKVQIAESWLRDRNPAAEVQSWRSDVMDLEESALADCDLVVSCTDGNGARYWINDFCIAHSIPMTVGIVHRGGVGGTVLAFRPSESGCYGCMELAAEGLDGLPSDDELPLTGSESELIYGRRMTGYTAPGLSADIAAVTALHAQVTIGELIRLEAPYDAAILPSEANWISVRFRSAAAWQWSTSAFFLPKIDGCVSCGTEAT
jgi:hypothetical protein